jgi:hypothetical protein
MKTSSRSNCTALGRVSTSTKGNAFSVAERIGLHEPTGISLIRR